MSSEIANIIQKHLAELMHFNGDDPLVNLKEESAKLHVFEGDFSVKQSEFPNRILVESTAFKKETGSNSLSITDGLVGFEYDNKSYACPVFLDQLTFSKNKFDQTVEFQQVEESRILNPFLTSLLRKEFQFETERADEEVVGFIEENIGEIQSKRFIGNIHHHRFLVLSELERLLEQNNFNTSLNQVLGFGDGKIEAYPLDKGLLFPADIDHRRVFEAFSNQNCIVQGPPGTGKSTLIANLIGKSIVQDENVLVFSEKRSALEVLVQKLATVNLSRLCFISSDSQSSKELIHQLRDNWQFFENYSPTTTNENARSEQYFDQLKFTLELLENPRLIGGVSLREFNHYSRNKVFSEVYSSNAISMKEFLEFEPEIEFIYEHQLQNILNVIQPHVLQRLDLKQLESDLRSIQSELNSLQKYHSFSTLFDLGSAMKKASKVQLVENTIHNEQFEILQPNSRKQKRFLALRKKYLKAKKKIDERTSQAPKWKVVPTTSQLNELQHLFQKSGFFAARKTKKAWENFSNLPLSFSSSMIEQQLEINEMLAEVKKLESDFAEINIHTPSSDIYSIYPIVQEITESEWNELNTLSRDERKNITADHARLRSFETRCKQIFRDENMHIHDAVSLVLTRLESLKLSQNSIEKLPLSVIKRIQINKDYATFLSEVLHSNWINFTEKFPRFKNVSQADLYKKVKEIIVQRKHENSEMSVKILNRIYEIFRGYQKILETPAHKLSAEEKETKKVLRKGKSVLIKEFSKSRRYKTTRELYHSEAQIWIKLLQPIWLTNASQLSANIPLVANLFDRCLFDESSQIPLQNAFGALQRSRRILVAGDSQQMGPKTYFSSQLSSVVDLLHQATYQLSSHFLSHHYRSKNAQLIAFSNRYFYANKLTVYPSYSGVNEKSVQHHFIAEGVFEDRTNKKEAQAVSEKIRSMIGASKRVGLVAFSQVQLNCILALLTPDELVYLHETADCFAKSVENVQGDECDELVISFGYGYNPEGIFEHRFGPMNQEGGRNRLNVLLTRARNSIQFFSSIRSTDFNFTDNSSVEMMKKWFQFIEDSPSIPVVSLPINGAYRIQGNTIELKTISRSIPHPEEMITLVDVLESRGWKVEFIEE